MVKKAKKSKFIIIADPCNVWKCRGMYLWFAEMASLFGQVIAVRRVHILSWCASRVWEEQGMEV